jgi:hypothetical protein
MHPQCTDAESISIGVWCRISKFMKRRSALDARTTALVEAAFSETLGSMGYFHGSSVVSMPADARGDRARRVTLYLAIARFMCFPVCMI